MREFFFWLRPALSSVSFFHTPFQDADEEQTYADNLVNGLAVLREERNGDLYGFYRISSFRTHVREVVVAEAPRERSHPKALSKDCYCNILCAIFRTFPNSKQFRCLPLVAPEGLSMLASRIKTIRETDDPLFAKNITTFKITNENLFNSLDGMKVVVSLAEVFTHALEFDEFNPKLANTTRDGLQRTRNSPEVQAVIKSDEYKKLQKQLRFILNNSETFENPVPSDRKDDKVICGMIPLFLAAINRMDQFYDADCMRGISKKNEEDLGHDEAMEVRKSLTYHILRDGLSKREKWWSYLRFGEPSHKNSSSSG